MSQEKSTISNDVMKRIKKGEVRMRPATYFSLLSISAIIAGLSAGIAMAYFSSIMFFWIRTVGLNSKAYGLRRDLAETIASFPWWTVAIFSVLTILTVSLIRRYGHLYKHKTRNVVILIVSLSLIAGITMSSFGIGDINRSRQNGQDIRQNSHRWQDK